MDENYVKEKLKEAEIFKKYNTTLPGIEIENNYYTFSLCNDNNHISIMKTQSDLNKCISKVVGITTKDNLKKIVENLNI